MVEGERPADLATVAAIAVVAYVASIVAHEALGHGVACVVLGGRPVGLNAVYFDCDMSQLSSAASRGVSAAGTVVNLVVGAIAWAAGRRATLGARGRYLAWLVMTVSLLQAAGYGLFSGLGGLGDWAEVTAGWSPAWAWRVGLALVGGVGYAAVMALALRTAAPFLGGGSARVRRGARLMLVPYLVGGGVYLAAAALNPVSPLLLLISGAASSLGGTSAMAWMYTLPRRGSAASPPLALGRSAVWLAIAALTAAVFIGVLGRTLTF
jgi:hypothetical protein